MERAVINKDGHVVSTCCLAPVEVTGVAHFSGSRLYADGYSIVGDGAVSIEDEIFSCMARGQELKLGFEIDNFPSEAYRG